MLKSNRVKFFYILCICSNSKKRSKIFKPSKKEVFDSFLTSEVWTVEPTQLVCVGSIKIKGIYKTIKYHVNQKFYIIHNHIYDWSWIEKYECYEKCFGKI